MKNKTMILGVFSVFAGFSLGSVDSADALVLGKIKRAFGSAKRSVKRGVRSAKSTIKRRATRSWGLVRRGANRARRGAAGAFQSVGRASARAPSG